MLSEDGTYGLEKRLSGTFIMKVVNMVSNFCHFTFTSLFTAKNSVRYGPPIGQFIFINL